MFLNLKKEVVSKFHFNNYLCISKRTGAVQQLGVDYHSEIAIGVSEVSEIFRVAQQVIFPGKIAKINENCPIPQRNSS